MTTTTIDSEHRAAIPGAVPEEKFWVFEDAMGYRLQRISGVGNPMRMSREEVVKAIASSKLNFSRDWEEMRTETREP